MTKRSPGPVLPDGVDETGYVEIRRMMRMSVLRIWRTDQVVAGIDPWTVVDEAWSSMAENGFRSAGPFLPFALRVAQTKAIDALKRAEARRRDRSLDEPISTGSDGGEALVLSDVVATTTAAEEEYFAREEHLADVRRLELAEEAIYGGVLSENEREAFLSVVRDGKSRAAVGRDLEPAVTGQRVGQIVAAATAKIKAYIDEHEQQGAVV